MCTLLVVAMIVRTIIMIFLNAHNFRRLQIHKHNKQSCKPTKVHKIFYYNCKHCQCVCACATTTPTKTAVAAVIVLLLPLILVLTTITIHSDYNLGCCFGWYSDSFNVCETQKGHQRQLKLLVSASRVKKNVRTESCTKQRNDNNHRLILTLI